MKKITPSNSLAHSVIFFPSPYQCQRWNNKIIFYSTCLVPTVNFDACGSCCPQGNTLLSNKTPDGDYIWRFKSHPSQIYCFEQSRSGDSDTSSKTTGKLKKNCIRKHHESKRKSSLNFGPSRRPLWGFSSLAINAYLKLGKACTIPE